jgi:ectoine hydroxylase-related dioxygenase (phytanoyl-CoA dioxygenase family)
VIAQGFAVSDAVFARSDLTRVIEALTAADLAHMKAGARHLLSVPAVRTLASDPRMLAIAEDFIGGSAAPFRATLFDKSPDTNWLVTWHQDTALPLRARVEDPAWGPWSVKNGVLYAHAPASALQQVVALRVSLDPSTASTGPLRVLPFSHQRGVLTDDEIRRFAGGADPVDCVTGAGGVVAMRPLTIHASSKARSPGRRRVLHIEYSASLTLAAGIELAIC